MLAAYAGFRRTRPNIGTRILIPVTNAVESLNRVIRKAIKTRGSFPSEQAAEKLIYLAIRGHEKTARTVRGWLTAVNQFAIMFKDRFSPMRG
jgi:transposase-like protein